MGIQSQHVPGAIILLVGPGLLVFSNHIVLVIIHVNTAHHADLSAAVHDLAIQIERGLPVADQCALRNKPFERSASAGVDPRVVRIGVLRQIDVGAPDMEEAVGIASCQLGGFVTIDHVVRDRSYPRGQLGRGSNGRERMQSHRIAELESELATGLYRPLAEAEPRIHQQGQHRSGQGS